MSFDPVARFNRWFADARRSRIPLYDACALATADRRGRPSVRFVLLKGADERGFVFYTNKKSRKGGELRANPWASIVFYWNKIDRQVRIEGKVREVPAEEADAYWDSRPRESNLGAIASTQSAPLSNRQQLLKRFSALKKKFRGKDIPRPAHWTGFRIEPLTIEFWKRGNYRLHHREEFRRAGRHWKRRILQP